ncbi:MAG: hypothetical protein CMF75_08095 [Maricaulis sp.]|nr:hypothetical protein [Maricaulis sp.]
MKLHYRSIELLVAACVVVISLASLFVALYQGRVMQRTMEASVMPLIQIGHGNFDAEDDAWQIKIEVTNTGLGPAQVHYLAMRWQGELITDTSDFMAACCVPDSVPEAERLDYMYSLFREGEMALIFDDVQMRFLAPQETVDFISFDQPDAETRPRGHAVWRAVDRARHDISYEVCYCSVFDQCWMSTFPRQSREPVRQCVPPSPEAG